MKKYGKRARLLPLVILAVLLTCCGGQGTEMEEAAISQSCTIESIPLEDCIRAPVLAGERVYYVRDNDDSGYSVCSMDINDGNITEKTLSLEDHLFNLANYTADVEGNLYFALNVKPEDDRIPRWEQYIMKWNAMGEEEYFQRVTEDIGYSFLNMRVDGQGRLSFQHDRVYQFDEAGQYLGGQEYVLDEDAAEQSYQQKLSLEPFGIDSEDVRDMAFLEDGRTEVLAQAGSAGSYVLYVLTPAGESVNEGKEELVLGVLQKDSLTQSLVADFNRSRQDIVVTIREYQPDGARTRKEAVSALMGDFLSGKGPDLIALSPGGNHALLAQEGMLEDLQPYVDQSDVVNREDFLPNVWELGSYGEIVYAVPMRFSLQTLVGKTSLVGERDGWTVAGLQALAGEYPDSLLVEPSSRSAVFSLCCTFQAQELVDRETAECYFDSPRFYEILEFADTFAPDRTPNIVTDEWKYREGRVLLMEVNLYDVDSVRAVYEAFGMEPLSFTGYPSGDGSQGHLLLQCNDMYGISSRSAHKQEAWEFVEYYVRWDEENARFAGFPADCGRLEQWLQQRTGYGQQPAEEEGGTPREQWLTAAALKELILHIAENAVTETGWGGEADIILEEAAVYFDGQRPVEDTVRALENRVSLYFNEQ